MVVGHGDRRLPVPRTPSSTGEARWGKIPAISQYVLIFIAVTFTWLMGLMGYVRSGLRQHWHVYGVMRDTSVDAFTPTLGFATQVVSVTVLHLLRPDRLRLLAREPGRQEGLGRQRSPSDADGRAMKVPVVAQDRGAGVGTTGFYTYVGQLVPQKEVHPPAEVEISKRHDARARWSGRPRDHGRQGPLLHLPHDRQEGRAALPRPRGHRRPRRRRAIPGSPTSSTWRSRSTSRTRSSSPASTPACR